jgi:hypothetical protein
MEGLGQLKSSMTSLGIETATFWLVAQRLNYDAACPDRVAVNPMNFLSP